MFGGSGSVLDTLVFGLFAYYHEVAEGAQLLCLIYYQMDTGCMAYC